MSTVDGASAGDGAAESTPGPLRSVSRALSALELFVDKPRLGTREIARALDLDPATVHRIMAVLTARGFVVQDQETKEFSIGPVVVQLTDSFNTNSADLRRVAMPGLVALRERLGETVALQVARAGCRVVVLQVESKNQLRMVVPEQPVPILWGPATDQVFRAFTDGLVYRASTDPTGDVPQWERDLEQGRVEGPDLAAVRDRGYAVSFGVRIAGGTSIAAPVFTNGETFALTVFGPQDRLSGEALDAAVLVVKAAAEQLSQTLQRNPDKYVVGVPGVDVVDLVPLSPGTT